ncbi:MAG TPA: hypothetical protein VGA29_01100, partial [Ignavibacteriaceae bacterium]
MKRIKEILIRNRKRFIIAVSLVLIVIVLINIHFIVNVVTISNDECLWKDKKIGMDSIAIFFDLVKVEGVTWEAGIRDGDQLLKINDITLPDRFEAQRILNKVNEGDFAEYIVKRGERIFTTDVRIKKLFYFHQLAQSLLALIWMLIGFVVLMAKPDGTVQKLFYGIGAASVLVGTQVILQTGFLFDEVHFQGVIGLGI